MKLLPLIAAVFCTALLCVALRVGATTSRTVADRVVGPSLSAAPATRVGSPPSPVRDLSSHRPHPSSHPHLNWNALAACESTNRWHIVTPPYYGGVQMNLDFWRTYGGRRYAARPDLASRRQQIRVGLNGYHARGSQPWPQCGYLLGGSR